MRNASDLGYWGQMNTGLTGREFQHPLPTPGDAKKSRGLRTADLGGLMLDQHCGTSFAAQCDAEGEITSGTQWLCGFRRY